jgi:hypothetical protein
MHDHHLYASTGRGLSLVEELTSTHGVQYAPGRKTVWFELWSDGGQPFVEEDILLVAELVRRVAPAGTRRRC